MVNSKSRNGHVIPYTSIYQQVGARKKSQSHKKASSRRKSRRSLPPALLEYRKLSDKVLKAIFGLSGLPDTVKDGAPMKKLIGKLLRDNNRDVEKIINLLSTSFVVREYEKSKKEIEINRKNKKASRSSSD